MIEITSDFWTYTENNPIDAICVTTNTVVKANGELVMGAGIAKSFSRRYPTLAKDFGVFILQGRKKFGESWQPPCFIAHEPTLHPSREYKPKIVYFPTKYNWKDPSVIDLIEKSLKELVKLTNWNDMKTVVMTRPGCGMGGLDWNSQVKSLCKKYLDDRFIIISKD